MLLDSLKHMTGHVVSNEEAVSVIIPTTFRRKYPLVSHGNPRGKKKERSKYSTARKNRRI
jgi:hypothetical protein